MLLKYVFINSTKVKTGTSGFQVWLSKCGRGQQLFLPVTEGGHRAKHRSQEWTDMQGILTYQGAETPGWKLPRELALESENLNRNWRIAGCSIRTSLSLQLQGDPVNSIMRVAFWSTSRWPQKTQQNNPFWLPFFRWRKGTILKSTRTLFFLIRLAFRWN